MPVRLLSLPRLHLARSRSSTALLSCLSCQPGLAAAAARAAAHAATAAHLTAAAAAAHSPVLSCVSSSCTGLLVPPLLRPSADAACPAAAKQVQPLCHLLQPGGAVLPGWAPAGGAVLGVIPPVASVHIQGAAGLKGNVGAVEGHCNGRASGGEEWEEGAAAIPQSEASLIMCALPNSFPPNTKATPCNPSPS